MGIEAGETIGKPAQAPRALFNQPVFGALAEVTYEEFN